MKKLLPVLVGILVVVAVLWWIFRSPESLDESLLTGNIEMTTVDITFPAGGRLLEVGVVEGERVARGQFLGRLDPTQLQATLNQTEARLAGAQGRIAESVEQLNFQRASLESQMADALGGRTAAEARLTELRSGSRVEEIGQAEAILKEAEAAADVAQQDLLRMQELFKTADISRQELDRSQSIANQAGARLTRAQESLRLVREGPRPEQIRAAEGNLARAEAALEQVRASRFETSRIEKSQDVLRSEADALRAELQRLQAALEDLAAESPIEGIVLTRNAEPGEVLPAGRPILRLADVERPWIRAYIPETMLGRVQVGTAVEVRTDSYPEKVYRGRISHIADEAEFTPRQIQTREQRVRWVYRIKIEVENPAGELKLNMPCDARILLDGGA